MTPKSHTLFHFTKSNETLKLVLKNGFWPRYCLEDVSWVGVSNTEFVAYPMVCFCDIPLSRVDEHVGFYGEFGVGLTKDWAETNGLSPIHYVALNSGIPASYKALVDITANSNAVDESEKEDEDQSESNGWELLRYLLAHAKPIEGRMVVAGKTINKEFHQESEWRYVPKHEAVHDFITRDNYTDEEYLAGRNNETKNNCMLEFSPKDVKYIFVKKDSDIPDIINFIQAELDNHPSSEVKVLLSRVTSLESISRDI